MSRIGRVERATNETKVFVEVNLDAPVPPTFPPASVSTTTCSTRSPSTDCST